MKFSEIPKVIPYAPYRINISWEYFQSYLFRKAPHICCDLNPYFQRDLVWTKKTKIKYIEFILKGGIGAKQIYTNCPGWMTSFKGPYELVDGKQRVYAVLSFLDNKLKVFGHYYKNFTDRLPSCAEFLWNINNLETSTEVLQWYIELNTSGKSHTKKEIEKVKKLLEIKRVQNDR